MRVVDTSSQVGASWWPEARDPLDHTRVAGQGCGTSGMAGTGRDNTDTAPYTFAATAIWRGANSHLAAGVAALKNALVRSRDRAAISNVVGNWLEP